MEYITHLNTFYIRCIVGTPTSALCEEFLSSFTNYSSRKWTRIIWCNYLRQGGYVFIGVCLSVSRITQKLYSTDFHKIPWKKPLWSLMVIWITLRYGCGQGKFMIMVRWGPRQSPQHCICFTRLCLMVTILQDQRLWRRYTIY